MNPIVLPPSNARGYLTLPSPTEPARPVYSYQTAPLWQRTILYVLSWTIGLPYFLIHFGVGKAIYRHNVVLHPDPNTPQPRFPIHWQVEKVLIHVNDQPMECIILTPPHVQNGRVAIYAPGSAEGYPCHPHFFKFVERTQAVWILMNYNGLTNKWALVNGCKGVLDYALRERHATQLIGMGNSLGGGIFRSALKTYRIAAEVRSVFVWNVTFSYLHRVIPPLLSPVVGRTLARIASGIVRLFGWNLGSLSISRAGGPLHAAAEVTIQARLDDMIDPQASLANELSKQRYQHAFGHNTAMCLDPVQEYINQQLH